MVEDFLQVSELDLGSHSQLTPDSCTRYVFKTLGQNVLATQSEEAETQVCNRNPPSSTPKRAKGWKIAQ